MQASAPKLDRARRLHKRGRWTGFFYILPWLIGFAVFQLYPFLASLFYSFTKYSFGKTPEFIGLDNYIRLFTRDKQFLSTLSITARYALIAVPGKLICALLVAMLLNAKVRGIGLYRTVYYMPSILGGSVAVSVLWRTMFMRDGMVNRFLGLLDVPPVDWLTDPSIALYTISLLQIWQFGSAMVIFLAALKQIPQELYEAAEVDGAGKLRQFFSVTLPQVSSVLFFNLIMQLISGFLAFTQSFIITQGKPLDSTLFYAVYMYEQSFTNRAMGYSSAMAWIMLVLIGILTLIIFKTKHFWVVDED